MTSRDWFMISITFATLTYAALLGGAINWAVSEHKARLAFEAEMEHISGPNWNRPDCR